MASCSKSIFSTSTPTRCFGIESSSLSSCTVVNNESSNRNDILKLEHVIRPRQSMFGYHIGKDIFLSRESEDLSSCEEIEEVEVLWSQMDSNVEREQPQNVREERKVLGHTYSQNTHLAPTEIKEKGLLSQEFCHLDKRRGSIIGRRPPQQPAVSATTKMNTKMAYSNVLHHSTRNVKQSGTSRNGDGYGVLKKNKRYVHNSVNNRITNTKMQDENSVKDFQPMDCIGKCENSSYGQSLKFEETTEVDEYLLFMHGSDSRRNVRRRERPLKFHGKTKTYWIWISEKCRGMLCFRG